MNTSATKTIVITGARKGIGRFLAVHYLERGFRVVGCSRTESDLTHDRYRHFCLDVSEDTKVTDMMGEVRKLYGGVDILINNAGVASMNHALLTPMQTARNLVDTNFLGTFLFCREAAKQMQKNRWGRIINFATVAVPLKLEGEAIYAASKAAVVSLTQVLANELGASGVTVNAVGPTPIATDLISKVPAPKIENLVKRQAIARLGKFEDVANVTDFFIREESDFITGQTIYLGGIS